MVGLKNSLCLLLRIWLKIDQMPDSHLCYLIGTHIARVSCSIKGGVIQIFCAAKPRHIHNSIFFCMKSPAIVKCFEMPFNYCCNLVFGIFILYYVC